MRDRRLARAKTLGHFLYLSADSSRRKQQMAGRQVHGTEPSALGLCPEVRVLPDELKAAIVLFYGLLDEKQRRVYAGLEAMKFGHAGDQHIADLLGLDPGTVARVRRELLAADVETDRTQPRGKTPQVLARIEEL